MPSSMMVRSAVKLVSNTLSKPHAAQGRVHLEGHRRARLEAEALADGRPRAGRRLDDDVLVGVVDGGPDLVGRVLGVQGAGRAAVDALAAVDADDVGRAACPEGRDA